MKELEAALKMMLREKKSLKEESEKEAEEGEDLDEARRRNKPPQPQVEKKLDSARRVEFAEPRRSTEGRRSKEVGSPGDKRPARTRKEAPKGGSGKATTPRESEDEDAKFEMLEYP